MENKNIRTMIFISVDHWDRPIYKCIETGILYKDITLGSDNPDLYDCGNELDGDPGFPIKNEIEVKFKEKYKPLSSKDRFNYALLGRLKSDCDYYLGHGNGNPKHLWGITEIEHIKEMKKMYNSFSDDMKPEWLTYDEIIKYEKSMIKGGK